MDFKELKQSLLAQKASLILFLETLIKQRRAIIENNILALEESIAAEEHLLVRIHSLEKVSREVIRELIKTNSLKVQNYSLSSLIKAVSDDLNYNVDELQDMQYEIQQLVTEISRANEHNRVLVNHARSFVRETINSLVNENSSPMLDRKL